MNNELTKEEILELQESLMRFLTSGSTDEQELIRALENKTLNLTSQQIKILMILNLLGKYDNFFNDFVKKYLEYKQYNYSYRIILKGIELISLYNFIKGRLKFNINLSK